MKVGNSDVSPNRYYNNNRLLALVRQFFLIQNIVVKFMNQKVFPCLLGSSVLEFDQIST